MVASCQQPSNFNLISYVLMLSRLLPLVSCIETTIAVVEDNIIHVNGYHKQGQIFQCKYVHCACSAFTRLPSVPAYFISCGLLAFLWNIVLFIQGYVILTRKNLLTSMLFCMLYYCCMTQSKWIVITFSIVQYTQLTMEQQEGNSLQLLITNAQKLRICSRMFINSQCQFDNLVVAHWLKHQQLRNFTSPTLASYYLVHRICLR